MVGGARTKWGPCFRTVSLNDYLLVLSYCNNTIAVASTSEDIIILNAITGSQTAVLTGHTSWVRSVNFSSDGRSLVSGSNDTTVKFWNMQTDEVFKTFYGHTMPVFSVSISADYTRIAPGSEDNTIHSWNIQTGELFYTIEQEDTVSYVGFFPTDPQLLFSICNDKVLQWDIDGHQIPPTHDGTYIAFSPDHTQLALCNGKVVTVQNSNSRAVVAEWAVANNDTSHCCFSPDGRLIAVAVGATAYVWNITSSNPSLVETFVDHANPITSLVFSSPSSLVSASFPGSIKFWKIGILPTDPVAIDLGSTPPTSPSIQSVSLQTEVGIAVPSNEDRVVANPGQAYFHF